MIKKDYWQQVKLIWCLTSSGGNDNGNMLVGRGFITFSDKRVAIIQNEVHDCDLSVLQVVEGGTPTTICLFEDFDFI